MRPYVSALLFTLVACAAQAVEVRGQVTLRYADGTTQNPARIHVFVVDRRAMDEYLRPRLPSAATRYRALNAEFQSVVFGYSPGMNDEQRRAYERRKIELVESFDALLPDLLTGFPGKPIASATTDGDGRYRVAAEPPFYIVVLANVTDEGASLHHIWLVPDTDLAGPYLDLDPRNRTPNVYVLYKKFYP